MKIAYLLCSIILVEFLNTSSKEFVTTNDFFSRIASPSPGSWARNERTWKRIWKSFRLSQKLNPIPSHLVVNATKYTLEFLVSNISLCISFFTTKLFSNSCSGIGFQFQCINDLAPWQQEIVIIWNSVSNGIFKYSLAYVEWICAWEYCEDAGWQRRTRPLAAPSTASLHCNSWQNASTNVHSVTILCWNEFTW